MAADAGSVFNGTIGIDLQSGNGRLNVSQMATTTLVGTLDGAAAVDIQMTVAPDGAMTPPITANLDVDWNFTDAAINPGDTNVSFGDRPSVSFDTVSMDLGAFMGDFIAPLIEQVDSFLDPIRPVLEIMTASIKVLEDFPGLGNLLDATGDGRVTLLDILALKFPSADIASFEEFANIALQIADWADFLANQAFAGGDLALGSFDLGTADIRAPGFDLATAVADFQGLAGDLNSVVASLTGTGWSSVDPASGQSGREILQSILGDGIFDLPVLTDPSQWMNLFLGQVADLVTVDMPTVSFDTGTKTILSFPIFPLVFFDVSAGFEASFNFDFGFDTRGLLDPTLNAIDGLYLIDGPGAEIMLAATMAMGISVNVGVLSATAQGDMTGTILMDLKDPLQQSEAGKLYFDELGAAFADNPFSIFDASGSITVGFSAIIDSLLGEIWRWDSPRVTLGNFGFDNVDQGLPPGLASKSGHTLTLNVGDLASNRAFYALPTAEAEFMSVSYDLLKNKTVVEFLGMTQSFGGITKVVGDSKHGLDGFHIDEDLLIAVDYSGGTEDDILEGAALGDTLDGNAGNDALFGRGGNDVLNGNNDDDYLDGGEGADTIDGGSGNDRVSYLGSGSAIQIDFAAASQKGGTAQGDVLSGIEILDGSNFADSVVGSQGDGLILGYLGDDTLRSGGDDQAMFGNAGNDLLEGGGHDTLAGGEGDDIYIVRNSNVWINENEIGEIVDGSDSGYDWVQGYASIDLSVSDAFIERITLKGKALEAIGNGIDNLIQGNAVDNFLYGLEGNDSLFGNAGNDTLSGHDGNDLLFGGVGNDTIYGASGADKAFGGDGMDEILGGSADDTLFGGAGLDYLAGEGGADLMVGGTEADYYKADASDTLIELKGRGIDYVFATEDLTLKKGVEVEILAVNDLYGAAWGLPWPESFGTPRAEGYFGLTRAAGRLGPVRDADLTGNEFDQVLIADLGDGDNNVVNHLEGMVGADTIIGDFQMDFAVYSQSDAAVDIDLTNAVQHGGHAEGDYLYGIHHLIGSAFDDTLRGEDLSASFSHFENEINGEGGNDLILGRDGLDTLRGGDGKDTIYGGGSSNAQIYGGDGRDLMFGGSGFDTLDGGEGLDTMNGGMGDDKYTVTLGDRLIDAGGDDTATAIGDYFLQAGVEIETLKAEELGATSANSVLYGNTFGQKIVGNSGDNFIHGGNGADTINGGAGRDTASYFLSSAGVQVDLNALFQSGGAAQGDHLTGIEQLQGSVHDDVLIGNATTLDGLTYDDEHFGFAGDDRIEDVLGVNTLHGGEGDDTLLGSGASGAVYGRGSLLSGGDGNDSLDGGFKTGSGGDTLVGGLGDDTYHVTSAGDVVDENFLGEVGRGVDGGHDLLISDLVTWSMDTATQADIEDAALGVTGVNLTGNDLDNQVTGNGLNNSLSGLGGDDTLEGLDGADTLNGGEGNDLLRAGDGDDTANGGNGDDTLYGSTGSDTLNGGNGNDSLHGGVGSDVLTGGAGDDIFIVDDTADIATDNRNGGQDLVRSSVTFTLSVNIENITLIGSAAVNATGNALDNVLRGNSEANRLNGLAGADTMTGGLGADIFVFSTALDAAAADTITDFTALDDTIRLENAIFSGLTVGILTTTAFRSNLTGLAQDATDRIIYETDSGNLYFDEDGTGVAGRKLFATLSSGLSLNAADFEIV
ncbi:MAG: calcium-binding protein [bacterium]